VANGQKQARPTIENKKQDPSLSECLILMFAMFQYSLYLY